LNFAVIFRKEIIEHFKTYKILIAVAVLLILGLSEPLLLKFLPEILRMSGEQISIQLPQFGAADAIKGYVGDLGQIGLLVAVLISMGSIAQERERRTAVMTLSKPVGFGAFITAKLAALAFTFGIGLVLGACGCYLYTVVLIGKFSGLDFLVINLLAAFYLLFCLSLTVMFSAFFRSQLAAGGLALVSLIILASISGVPLIGKYLPNALTGWATDITLGREGNAWPALIVNAVLIVATIIAGWQVLKRKEI
jgi:ABC-2 type transport system permease protein